MTQILVLEHLPLEESEALPRNHLRNSRSRPGMSRPQRSPVAQSARYSVPAEAPDQRLEWGAREVIWEASRPFFNNFSFQNTFGRTHVLVLENVPSTDRTLTRNP